MKRLLSTILIMLMLAVPCSARGESVGSDISGMSAVTFYGETVTGEIFSENLLTVVNIWQRWCGPCMGELPFFKRLNEEYVPAEGCVGLLGALYFTRPDEIDEAVAFVELEGYDWLQVLAPAELLAAAGEGTEEGLSVPQTLIVDRFGIIRAQHRGGFSTYDELFGLVKGWEEVLRTEALGDVDGDHGVTVNDALLTLRMAMGLIPVSAAYAADADGNGSVDISDALFILRFSLGLN